MVILIDFVARFAEEDDVLDVGRLEDFENLGEVLIVGFIATAEDKNEIVVRKSINGDASRRGIGREIVVVEFDVAKLAEKL